MMGVVFECTSFVCPKICGPCSFIRIEMEIWRWDFLLWPLTNKKKEKKKTYLWLLSGKEYQCFAWVIFGNGHNRHIYRYTSLGQFVESGAIEWNLSRKFCKHSPAFFHLHAGLFFSSVGWLWRLRERKTEKHGTVLNLSKSSVNRFL